MINSPQRRVNNSYCYGRTTKTTTTKQLICVCYSQGGQRIPCQFGWPEARKALLAGPLQSGKHWWICVDKRKSSYIYSLEYWNARYGEWPHISKSSKRSKINNLIFLPGSQQGCVAMTTGILAGLWNLLPCSNTEKYICKHLAEGAVLTVPPPTQAPPSCEEGWTRVGTRNYCAKVQEPNYHDRKNMTKNKDEVILEWFKVKLNLRWLSHAEGCKIYAKNICKNWGEGGRETTVYLHAISPDCNFTLKLGNLMA